MGFSSSTTAVGTKCVRAISRIPDMQKEKLFISESSSKEDIPKKPQEYFNQELREDISVFPPETQEIIFKELNGVKLTVNELKAYNSAVNDWWRTKYGFPFNKKTAREEVLARKYYSSPEMENRKNLQTELFRAVSNREKEKIKQLREKYAESYPDQLEGVETLFGIIDFLKKQSEFNKKKIELDKQKRMEIFQDFTEYQFLFTHFIILNGNDKEFMDIFWKAAFAIAERMKKVKEFNTLRRSIISQAAAYKIIEAIGGKPKLSHPEEDAFRNIDLWTDKGSAIQIKGWEEETPMLIESDEITFPAVRTDDSPKTSKYFDSREFYKSKNSLFRAKIKEYGEQIGRKISGYMLVIPYSKIDFITGEPDPQLVEFFKKEIKIDR